MKTKNKKISIGLIVIILLGILYGCSADELAQEKSNNEITSESTEQESVNNTPSEEGEIKQPELESRSPINLTKANVSRVVDGDTIEVNINNKSYKVRMIGINTPESTTRQEPYGKEASNYTKSQLTGKTVYLEKDVSETDKYGRLLRYVWIEEPKEISEAEIKLKMFNAILVTGGYAQQSTYPPDVKYTDYFKKFAVEARNGSKGLWAINSNGTTRGDEMPTNSGSSSDINNESSFMSGSESTSEGKVYWLTSGTSKSYHKDINCKYIKGKVTRTGSIEEAVNDNHSDPCNNCVK